MPFAALIARRDLDVAGHAAIGHYTHEKSPLGSAAALAVIAVIEREGLIGRAQALGEQGSALLKALKRRHPSISTVRHFGAFFGVELRTPDGAPDIALADAVLYAALDLGLSFKVGSGNVICLCPPLTISDDELRRSIEILDMALGAASRRAADRDRRPPQSPCRADGRAAKRSIRPKARQRRMGQRARAASPDLLAGGRTEVESLEATRPGDLPVSTPARRRSSRRPL